MITLKDIKNNEEVKALIKGAQKQLDGLGYTEHAERHLGIVSMRTGEILEKLGYNERTVELGKIAAYLNDIGNCVNRVDHAHSGITGRCEYHWWRSRTGRDSGSRIS